jgi:hypothetical protein
MTPNIEQLVVEIKDSTPDELWCLKPEITDTIEQLAKKNAQMREALCNMCNQHIPRGTPWPDFVQQSLSTDAREK